MKPVDKPTDLRGLWPALPTAFRPDGSIDYRMLEENVAKFAQIPVEGLYTTDSDGEFYAVEFEDFKELVRVFAKAMEPTTMAAAVGVTWSSTRGIIDRLKVAVDHGIPAVHVAFPYWMPMHRDDMFRFWDDLARAVPAGRWIHYNTGRAHLVLGGSDYARLYRDYPQQFIGTKQNVTDQLTLVDCMRGAPDVSHFVIDFMVMPGMMLGAKGTCSFWANTMPHWMRGLMDDCLAGRWEDAMRKQQKLLAWELGNIRPLNHRGYLLATTAKARWELTGFLSDTWLTAPPYYPVPDEDKAKLRTAFAAHWADDLPDHQHVPSGHAARNHPALQPTTN